MEESIRGLLGIQGWIVYGVREEAEGVVVRVGQPRKGARCERCGEVSLRVHQRMKWRRVWHMGIGGKGVYLEIRRRRYWCEGCQSAFSEGFEEVRKWSRHSRMGEALLKRELSGQSFGAVERKTGLGYRALRGVVERAEVEVKWEEVLKAGGEEGIYLGIDGHSFRGQQMVETITEVRQHRVLAILPDDRQKTLEHYLTELPEEVKASIREVAIDMNEKARAVVEKVLKGARVVVDRFHVIQDANRRINETRKLEQQMSHREIKKSPSWWDRRGFQIRIAYTWKQSLSNFPRLRSSGGPRSN